MIDKKLLKQLLKQGLSYRRISRELKCSFHKVIYWVAQHDLKAYASSDTSAKIKAMLTVYTNRIKEKRLCKYCNKPFIVIRYKDAAGNYKKNKDRVCCNVCWHTRGIKTTKNCKRCNTAIYKYRDNDFCITCGLIVRYEEYICRWKKGLECGHDIYGKINPYIRRYLFEKYKNKCSKCGWGKVNRTTGNVPLTVNHKDGNWKNCKEKNLELICPNCHSLTSNYGSLNKGKGRTYRYAWKKAGMV